MVAISALECLFLLTIVVSLRPYVAALQVEFDLLMLTTNFIARCFEATRRSGSGMQKKYSGGVSKKQSPHRLLLARQG